jgi:hypothetical protein
MGRITATAHMIDRACIGHCFSYANYEPGTAQFRVRALAGNPIVVSTYQDSWDIQTGVYHVKDRDLPLYQIQRCGESQSFCVRQLKSGETAGADCEASWE